MADVGGSGGGSRAWGGRGGSGVLMSCMAVVRMTIRKTLGSLQCRGTEHVGFSPTRQTLIACTKKREVALKCSVSVMEGELYASC